MKVLKKIKEGLISHQFISNNSQVQEPLYIDGNYSYTEHSLNLHNGIVYFYVEDYKNLVFEICDNFEPKNAYDIGGISVIQGDRIYNLYQYENDIEDINYTRSRVTKIINNYYGEGSGDDINWHNKGKRFLSNAEVIGVTYESNDNVFELNEIKIYKEPSWYIHGLYEGYKLEIYTEDESVLLHDIIVDFTNIIKITDVIYPISYKIKAWNTDNEQILDFVLFEVWGGDEYYISIDIELYNHKRILLHLEEAKHLGSVKYDKSLKELIYVVNKSNSSVITTIRISEASPAYNWVELEYLDTRSKKIIIPLDALDETEFYITVTQPNDDEMLPTDYVPNQDYIFYLEVL